MVSPPAADVGAVAATVRPDTLVTAPATLAVPTTPPAATSTTANAESAARTRLVGRMRSFPQFDLFDWSDWLILASLALEFRTCISAICAPNSVAHRSQEFRPHTAITDPRRHGGRRTAK